MGTALGDIAERTEVSRSTLHRYFPERQDLVDGLLADSLELMGRLDECAAPTGRGALEVLTTTLHQLVSIGDRVMFFFADPTRFDGTAVGRAGRLDGAVDRAGTAGGRLGR